MSKLYAAFGEYEIPCDIGALTCGWIPPERKVRFKADDIQANIAVLKNDEKTIVMISLDVLQVDHWDADVMRREIAKKIGVGYEDVMISATHNHCGPAIVECYDCDKDEELVIKVKDILVNAAADVCTRLEPAVWGTGFTYENDITWNRRYIMRDGYSFAHPIIEATDVLCAEGPIDPQVGVICVRNMKGYAMGYVVNFACHPLFQGGQRIASANYIGALRKSLKEKENDKCVTVFINGAAGDIAHANPFDRQRTTKESVGQKLAERSYEVALKVDYTDDIVLDSVVGEAVVQRRHLSDEHITRAKQVLAGEDVVIDPSWHPVSSMDKKVFAAKLIELRETEEKNPDITLPMQAIRIGETAWVTTPCELFVRLGMEIKLRSKTKYTYIAGYTNGQIGYVGTPEAYMRGGYETTPCGGSIVEVDTGAKIVDAAVELVNKL